MRRAWVVLACLGACVRSDAVTCPDGQVCPAGSVCVALETTLGPRMACASADQITACAGLDALATCGDGRRCYGGACLDAGCGNALLDPGEVCDDDNTFPGDGCSADCTSDETCGNGVIDSINDEQCDDGPDGAGLSHDGCSSNCLRESATWTALAPTFFTNEAQPAAYDTARGRLVVVASPAQMMQTWEWDGRTWELRTPSVSPPPRRSTAVAYDAARRRVVLFGGLGFDDTWEWDGTTWTQALPAVSPPARGYHAMTYDPIGKRVVMFGGTRTVLGAGFDFGDTWTWDGTVWTQLPGTGPSPRALAAMTFDPRRGTIVLYGGAADLSTPFAETWELRGDTWIPLAATGPGGRYGGAFGVDPASGALVLAGGAPSTTDAWTFDGTTWTPVPTTTNLSQYARATTMHRGLGLVVLDRGDVYRWASGWQPLERGTLPVQRYDAAFAVEPVSGRTTVLGGSLNGAIIDYRERWSGTWTDDESPTPVGALAQAAMVVDGVRGELVVFGGRLGDNNATANTWTHDGQTWTLRQPATSPSPRGHHVMVFDEARGETVMFGGGPAGLDDTWIWDGTTWTARDLAVHPSARTEAAAAYDPVRRVVVLFGGRLGITLSTVLRDTWEWDGQAWQQRATTGPPARLGAKLAWDPARRRMILTGGATGSITLSDAWEWDGQTWSAVPLAQTVGPRAAHASVTAPRGGGIVVLGGRVSSSSLSDAAWLRWRSDAPEELCDGGDHDGDGLRACADPDCWWTCQPLCPPGVTGAACTTGPRCGDGTCDPRHETCATCPGDCGACPASCGDFACEGGETQATCPGDCTP